MWPGRIAVAPSSLWSAACLALAGVVFVNLPRMESPERYRVIALVAMGILAGAGVMIWRQIQYGRAHQGGAA
jgi:hypothetical protein